MALDDLLAKQVPYSVEAEQAVLGSMLVDPRTVSDVMEILKMEDFYMEATVWPMKPSRRCFWTAAASTR